MARAKTDPPADPDKAEAVDAAVRIMEELARWLITEVGVSVTHARDMMKTAYARAGCTLVPLLKSGEVNHSKVADVTGLFRQEIPALLKGRQEPEVLGRRRNQQRVQRIMDGWRRDYVEPDGSPAILPIRGQRRSFEALVRRHRGGTRFEAILSLLLDAGAAQRVPPERVQLLRERFASGRIDAARLADFGTEIAEHIRTACDNARRAEGDSLFAVRIESRPLDADPNTLQMLKNNVAARGKALADAVYLELTDPLYRPKPGGPRKRLVLMSYLTEIDAAASPARRTSADASDSLEGPHPSSPRVKRKRPR